MAENVETKAEWRKIENTLRQYGYANLLCDCDEVTLRVVPNKGNWLQLAIYVFLDGKIAFEDNGGKKYCMPRTQFIYKASARRNLTKAKKRLLKNHGYDVEEKTLFYDPRWTSFQALMKHFQKACDHVLLEDPYAPK